VQVAGRPREAKTEETLQRVKPAIRLRRVKKPGNLGGELACPQKLHIIARQGRAASVLKGADLLKRRRSPENAASGDLLQLPAHRVIRWAEKRVVLLPGWRRRRGAKPALTTPGVFRRKV